MREIWISDLMERCWVTESEALNERGMNPGTDKNIHFFKQCWKERTDSWFRTDSKEWSFEWERNESQSWSKRFTDSKIVLLSKRFADPKPDSLNGMGVNLCSNEIRKSNQNDRKNWVTQGVQRRIDIQPSFLFFLKCGKKFHEISLKFPKISVIRNEQALELCFCQTTL